ncbi:putative disease resistance protein At3g14460 isoform X2 [Malus domestica]
MPVQMCRLKSLRTLTAFVLGESTRSGGIGELGQLSNLRGKLSILNLQNVVNHMDALGANLKDKKDLNEVELAWGREDANDSVKERHVLESLQPSVNLVKLTIRFYGGTSFPDWLGDSSFSNIQVMRLSECSTCLSLPPVGRLPALEELYIERMKFVVSIGVEFYGGNGASLSQPFQSLKKLKFKEMPEWAEWLPCPGRGQSLDFPRLEELSLENCPKLRGNLPDHLPSLRQLWVSDCGVLHERATRTRWIPWSLIVNTESLRQSLEQLKIVRCPGLSSLLEKESLSSLSKLEIQFFSRGECLRPHLSNCLKDLTLYNCASLLSFPRNGLPTSLTFLHIENCRRLEFLSHEMMAKLTSLQLLNLVNSCDSLRSFPLGVFPKLSVLQILDNKNLESLAIGEGADDENLTHLDHLGIFDCPNLVSFPHGGLRTPKLAGFIVDGCEKLKLLPDRIHTLTALRRLRIYGLPNVESFAEGGLPPNLQSFAISGCEKLRPSVEYWGLQRLVSLRTFEIWSSEDLLETVLKEQLLPTTLHSLVISGMESLKSLEGKGLQHLTSLQELEIRVCDSLEFLPKEGLPASLSFLSIEKCSSLEKRCQKKTGQEWSKIAHIPFIKIDDQFII